MDKHKTKVIFRKYHGGGILACFPEQPGTNSPYTCLCYEHVGQHGSAAISYIQVKTTKPKDNEITELWKELQAIGYNIKRAYKFSQKHLIMRKAEIAR